MGLATVGLATAGVVTVGLATVGLATVGLATVGLATVGLATAGLATAGLATVGLEGRIKEEKARKAILSISPGEESGYVLKHLGLRLLSDCDLQASKAVHLKLLSSSALSSKLGVTMTAAVRGYNGPYFEE